MFIQSVVVVHNDTNTLFFSVYWFYAALKNKNEHYVSSFGVMIYESINQIRHDSRRVRAAFR